MRRSDPLLCLAFLPGTASNPILASVTNDTVLNNQHPDVEGFAKLARLYRSAWLV
jgi:hypothetical protein